jgi:predicted acetyltransferase
MPGVVLRCPRSDEEEEFSCAHRATTPEVGNFLHYYEEGMPFARYLEILAERARGEHLPPNHVPSTFLFAFDGKRIVGRVSIRHALNDLGLDRVLVTCDDDNVGSIRTIEKNGGVLENVVADPEATKPKRRDWIDTRR